MFLTLPPFSVDINLELFIYVIIIVQGNWESE